jgi:hypothetical protein
MATTPAATHRPRLLNPGVPREDPGMAREFHGRRRGMRPGPGRPGRVASRGASPTLLATYAFALILVGAIVGCSGDNGSADRPVTGGPPGPGGGKVAPSPGGGVGPDRRVDPSPGGGVGPDRGALVATNDPLGEPVKKVVYLAQNWSPDESVRFYFTAQGSQLVPYEWFLALEQATANAPFRDNQNLLRYRFLPQTPGPLNPDGLPVGFVAGRGAGRRWLGFTCAACHTDEIRLGDTGYRVDGAPTQADVPGFLFDLVGAMQVTHDDAGKFGRFAPKVLGAHDTPANRDELKTELARSIKIRAGYNLRNFPGYDPKQTAPTTLTRYGQLDAVDAIVNEVYWAAVKNPDPDKPTVVARPADAAVSYPFLWDTPQHDFVEWLGIAKGGGPGDIFSLSRNVGEVLGVFGDFIIPDDPSLLNLGYHSSVEFSNLGALEDLVKTLWSPLWPDDFPKIDRALAAKGEALYKTKLEGGKSCLDCHVLIDRTSPRRVVKASIVPTGTDSRAFDNFFHPTRPSGKLNGVNVNFVPFTEKVPPVSAASPMLSNAVIGVILGRFKDAPPDQLDRVTFGERVRAAIVTAAAPQAAYKGRSLNGIWATAPYLHNGSVPNLDALLRPASARPKSFSIGTRTFDPVKVGRQLDSPGFPRFQVANPDGSPITGHSNEGHEYGASLTDEQRAQLVEYLKTL